MKTYIARIQTPAGTQTIKLKAASLDKATDELQKQTKTATNGWVRYTIEEQLPLDSPKLVEGLTNATFTLIACVVALVVVDHQLRKWLKR